MPWWVWRYAPHAILAVLLGLAAVYVVHTLREQGRAELRPEIERLGQALAASEVNRARAEAASSAYRSEVDALRARPIPRTPVRLCRETPALPSSGTTAAGTDGGAAPTRRDDAAPRDDLAAGPDIGPDLYALAQSCDAEVAKLRALQGWINAVR